MDLVVFDLDGTLLNKQQRLSEKTIQVLEKLSNAGIHYTIATGRTHLAASPCIAGHDFPLWQIYKNGVQWWHPVHQEYRHTGILDFGMIDSAIQVFATYEVTPFIFCIGPDGRQSVFHPDPNDHYAQTVYQELSGRDEIELKSLDELPSDAQIINISALGAPSPLANIVSCCNEHEHLVAYSGGGIYHPQIHWIDIHHNSACKGSAIEALKAELNADNLVVFGDGDNDLTMFRVADEAYAMDNAPNYIKDKATDTVGHHDNNGVAEFLIRRYNL